MANTDRSESIGLAARKLGRQDRLGGLERRFVRAEADQSMDFSHRLDRVTETLPDWPAEAAVRLAERTSTYDVLFSVIEARPVHDLDNSTLDGPELLAAVDLLVDATSTRPDPSVQATLVAWARGCSI